MIVAAIDVSGSTSEVKGYFTKVQKILDDVTLPLKVILWSDKAYFYPDTKLNLQTVASYGGTAPETFVELLRGVTESFQLYIFTDGMISDLSVSTCKKNLDVYKIINKLIDVKLYYIGSESAMNLKLTDIFTGIRQEIFINDIVKSVGTMHPSLDLNCIDYEFVMKDDTLKATVLSKLNSGNVDKVGLKKDLQKLTTRILKSISDKDIIEPFYIKDDVTQCVNFIKENCYFPNSKAEFQRKMSSILSLFDENIDTYSLAVFNTIQPIELEYDEPEEEFQNMTCDILYENCKTVCFPVKKIVEEKKHFFNEERKMIQNPFRLLQSNEMLSKIIKLVEPYIMDYNTYLKIQNNKISPFTRDLLQGVYVLHNNTIDKSQLIQNNSYILSVLFCDKLPGNKVLWNIAFLYALAKNHQFSKHKELLYEEIKYLGDNFRHFVTLTPYMNPPYYEKLNVCFWYIIKVSHIVFTNSKKNLLRSMDVSPILLEFYNDVYEKVDLKEMNAWQLWKYFVLNKSNPSFIFYILAHHLNYKIYKNGEIVLFHGKRAQELEHTLDYIKHIDISTIMSLFERLMTNSNVTPYDDISNEISNVTEKVNACTISHNCDMVSHNCDMVSHNCELDHVSINIKTCHPYVICKVTGKHWKECAGNFDKEKESYLRMFRRYCIKKKMYPENVDDLIIYVNDYFLRHQKKPEIFCKCIENHFSKVLSLFESVMEVYSCEEYLKKANKYFNENLRLEME